MSEAALMAQDDVAAATCTVETCDGLKVGLRNALIKSVCYVTGQHWQM